MYQLAASDLDPPFTGPHLGVSSKHAHNAVIGVEPIDAHALELGDRRADDDANVPEQRLRPAGYPTAAITALR